MKNSNDNHFIQIKQQIDQTHEPIKDNSQIVNIPPQRQNHYYFKSEIFANESCAIRTLSHSTHLFFDKGITLSKSLNPNHQEQQFSVPVKMEIPQKLDIFKMITNDAQSLRKSEGFNDIIQHLRAHDKYRAERVQGDDQIKFIGSVNFVTETDCMTDSKEIGLLDKFPLVRQIRGDGNCLYSSVVFAYLEFILKSNDENKLIKLIENIYDNQLQMYDIYAPKSYQERLDDQQVILIPKIMTKTLTLEFLNSVLDTMKTVKAAVKDQEISFFILIDFIMNQINDIKGLYDVLIAFIRSIALFSFYKHKSDSPFCDFICPDLEDEIVSRIQTFEEEGDYLILSLICEVFPVEAQIIQWDNEKASQVIQSLKSQRYDSVLGTVYLKYIPEHYDIVYRDIDQYKQHTNFEIVDGYCSGCDDFVEGFLIRLRKCQHSFCLKKDHTKRKDDINNNLRCPLQSCTAEYPRQLYTSLKAEMDICNAIKTSFQFEPLFI